MVWYGMIWYGMVWYGMVWFMPTHPRPSFQLNMSLPTHRRASKLSISWNPKEVIFFDFFLDLSSSFPVSKPTLAMGYLGEPSLRKWGNALCQKHLLHQAHSDVCSNAMAVYQRWTLTHTGGARNNCSASWHAHFHIVDLPDCQLTWLAIFCKAYSCQLVDGPNLKAVKDLKAYKL